MLVSIVYELLLYIYALYALPKMLYQKIFHGKYQNSFSQRFGSEFPKIVKGDRPLVWIHAVSLGETRAVSALAKLIKKEYHNAVIVVSSITETGHAEAKKSMSFADFHVYLPFDFRTVIDPIVQKVKPDLVVLCETDYWFNFLKACKRQNAKIAVVNGKLSERSMKRYLCWPTFAKRLFGYIDIFCVQNKQYAERYKKVGVPPEKISITGNLKFDDEYPKLSREELNNWKQQLGIAPTDLVLVVGSTHDPEESLIIDAMNRVWQDFPNVKVMIVPRHPERFSLVSDFLAEKGVPFVRYGQIANKKGNEKVIVMDTMGLLRKCYQLADIAIVAGSYTSRVGGHNIIEPCWFGIPVIFGPYMHTQAELVALVEEYSAGLQVPVDNLAETLLIYFQDAEKRHQLGKNGEKLVSEMRGATVRTWDLLKS